MLAIDVILYAIEVRYFIGAREFYATGKSKGYNIMDEETFDTGIRPLRNGGHA